MSRSEYMHPAPASSAQALRTLAADPRMGLALTLLSALLALWSVYRIGVWFVYHLRRAAEAWVGGSGKKKKLSDGEEEEEHDARRVRMPYDRQ